VDRLSNVLSSAGYLANGLHGDMEQRQRETVIKGFKNNGVKVLVATDVAARGIHVDNISHVFNYHIPFDPESYVHRIGRTGRAGTKGKAITLLTPLEFKELQRIKQKVGTSMAHAFVPSKNDLRKTTLTALVKKIEEQHIYDEAHKVLDLLRLDIDEEKMAFKLISMLLDNQEIKGPNNIGIAADRIEAILERAGKRNDSRGGGYKGKNRSSGGGNRSGGGGGSRSRDGGGSAGGATRSREGGSGGGYRGNSSTGGRSAPRTSAPRHRD
jgi:ATP-dependent RNA helicase DeaD